MTSERTEGKTCEAKSGRATVVPVKVCEALRNAGKSTFRAEHISEKRESRIEAEVVTAPRNTV